MASISSFPSYRGRRIRCSESIRELVRENNLAKSDFVYPMFVKEGVSEPQPIRSMPGVSQIPVNHAVEKAREVHRLGIPAVILFGIPDEKDEVASGAYDPEGIVQLATRAIKDAVPELVVIADVCLCEYTSHGHCGVVDKDAGDVLNDPTLELLVRTAASQVEAGADIVAPSDMMDGRVAAIRAGLDREGFENVPIMSYAAKYAPPFLDPSGKPPRAPPSSAIGGATRWTRPTAARLCGRSSWTSRRARTS